MRTNPALPPFEPAPRPALPSPVADAEETAARMSAGFLPEQEVALALYLLAGLPAAVHSIRGSAPGPVVALAPLIALGLPDGVGVGLSCAIYDGARRGVRDYLAACHLAGIQLPGLAPAGPAGVASLAALGFPVAGPTASLVGRLAAGGQRPPAGPRFAVGVDGGTTDLHLEAGRDSAADSGPADPA